MARQPINMQPIEFKPYEFKYVDINESLAPNINYLSNALEKNEQRKRLSEEKQLAFKTAASELYTKLSPDEKTKSWVDNYITNKLDEIDGAVQSGDFGEAIKIATKNAGDILTDSQVRARQIAWENYKKKFKDDLDKIQGLDPTTKATFEEWNQFDADKTIELGRDGSWHAVEQSFNEDYNPYSQGAPVTSIDVAKFCEEVAKSVAEERTGTSVENANATDSKYTNKEGGGKGSSSAATTKTDYNRSVLSKERLNIQGENYFEIPEKKAQFFANYRNLESAVNKAKANLDEARAKNDTEKIKLYENSLKELLKPFGTTQTMPAFNWDDYGKVIVGDALEQYAYDWKQTSTVHRTSSGNEVRENPDKDSSRSGNGLPPLVVNVNTEGTTPSNNQYVDRATAGERTGTWGDYSAQHLMDIGKNAAANAKNVAKRQIN